MKLGIVLFLTLACIVCVKGKALKDCSSLEKLNFSDLLEKSKECRDETRKVFENKYVDYKFLVQGAFVDEDKAIEENGEEREIFVKNFEVIKRILVTFGDLMSKIEIDFADIDAVKEGKEIVQHLNGIKLEVLALRNCKGNVLDEWKNPFPNVVSFWFTSSSKDKLEIKNDKKLHQLLPKLNWLKLDYTNASDWEFFGDELKELMHFEVHLPKWKKQERPDETHVLNLLKNSKELEWFIVKNANLKLLKGVNDLLPGLKNLLINSLSQDYSDDKIDKIEFANIKTLSIATETDQIPDKIFFNGLESIALHVQPKFSNKWLEFISQKIKNYAVNSFELASQTLSHEDLLQIADKLPHLKTIGITTSSKFSANEIEVFINSNKELKSLYMGIEMDEAEQTKFSDKFQKHWKVTLYQMGSKTSVQLQIIRLSGSAPDCSLVSLEKLNFNDLLGKSDECRDETRKVFENKYVDFKFLVQGAFVDEDKAIEENGEEREIFVKHFEVIKRVLDTFGDLMSKIDIDFADIDAIKEGKEIVQHLTNGFKLEVLALRNCKGNVLDEWKNPFPNVVSFWFTSSSKDKLEIKNDKKLHQLLPKLNWLRLSFTKASDWGFFGNNHKELTSFIVELPNSKEQERPDDTHVLSLLKNSKKLESFAVANTNLKLLKGVEEFLPGLKTLIINSLAQDYSDDQVDKVKFSYIQFLWITAKADQTPEKVYFNGLKSISLDIEPNFNDKWFEFLSQKVKNDAVGSFVLRSKTLSREDLLKIVDNLPHLKTIEITSSSKFSAYEIEVFVGDSKELNSLKMDIQMDEPEQTQFSEEFKKHWNVTVIQSDPKTSVHLKITRAADPEPEKGSAGSLAPHSMQLLIVSLVVALVKALAASF